MSAFRNLIIVLLLLPLPAFSQQAYDGSVRFMEGDPSAPVYSLNDCIRYALANQASIRQAAIDVSIAKTNKSIALAGWLPQVNLAANYQHYLELPTSFLRVNDVLTPIKTGVSYTSNPQLTATQNIFSNDVLLANRTANIYTKIAEEIAIATKMDIAAAVSRTYYDVLANTEKVKIFQQDTQRLRKNQADAYHRFVSGIADKVDYKQATISLNNAMTQLKSAYETAQATYALLRFYTGIPPEQSFRLNFDTSRILQEVTTDTTFVLRIERRPEYRRLLLEKKLQHIAITYYNTGFIPSLSAYYTYNYQFQNNNASQLFNQAYPNSFVGAQFSVPLFTGFRRLENIHKSRLQEERIDWDIVNIKLSIYSEYRQAVANYKNNLYGYQTQADNLILAKEVSNVVKLQYNEGVKAYLDVIISETDLQTAEINYQNALFELLKSKTDLERALGLTPVQ